MYKHDKNALAAAVSLGFVGISLVRWLMVAGAAQRPDGSPKSEAAAV